MVFFREERLSDLDAAFGPRGAQGVPLTPGRSIAVDPGSIPYGTPVWLVSPGPSISLQKLVLARDTGSAIVTRFADRARDRPHEIIVAVELAPPPAGSPGAPVVAPRSHRSAMFLPWILDDLASGLSLVPSHSGSPRCGCWSPSKPRRSR